MNYKRCKERKFCANLSKCEFWLVEVCFIGNVISDESMVMDPSEVDVVIQREAPKLVNENRNFLDFSWLLSEVMEDFFQVSIFVTSVDLQRVSRWFWMFIVRKV